MLCNRQYYASTVDSAIAAWVVEVLVWECLLCLQDKAVSTEPLKVGIRIKSSPYAPRPIFMATLSSRRIMKALRLARGSAKVTGAARFFMAAGCDEERVDSRRCPCSEVQRRLDFQPASDEQTIRKLQLDSGCRTLSGLGCCAPSLSKQLWNVARTLCACAPGNWN